ncbi:carboxypeptidase-like regulatory domain-containing protein [Sphingobacterium oryzagri]|uniref:Carboxypeptidase-like regulatory domain-containing protein n=1 Tax=Sphingobacterium oryzagri TaxID=3025669 RepID=A0ABY7WH67_9SPHI|nr:carboxypeptidase-like regulatory domain-containing protein [Sphingobacterium sp. KACC 22765]WDF68840.1 carboxypeptidase-like regulatory domain-containing protein [Sphingobacterium sp. KACC 22765]
MVSTNKKLVLTCFLLTFLGVMLHFGALAQGTQASIRGTISNESNTPVGGVTVRVKNESTGFTTTSVTNERGNYDIKQLPLGGPYTVTATHVQDGDGTITGLNLNQGDVAQVNIQLLPVARSLDAIEISAFGLKNTKDYLGAATAFSSKDISTLPINGRNFTVLTDLSPLTSGGSIAGQLGSSTNFTIDGMNAKNPTSAGSTTARSGAPYSVSIEAVREFKVVTNQYDVTFGRSGGGTISAATKSGTNELTGSAFFFSRADWLTSNYDIRGNNRLGNYTTNQYGFSLGGPIIKDKLHFFFVWDRQQDNRSLLIADVQSPADEVLYRINQTTLDNYLGIARDKYGVSSQQQTGSIDKKRTSDAGFLRLDWQINEKNLLTIRNNLTYDYNPLGLGDNSNINLLESYGTDKNFDNSFLATLRTSISPRITNELKVQHLYVYQNSTQNEQIGSGYIPRAIVDDVVSNINGSNLSTSIQLGGHRFAQEGFKNNVLQLTNNLFYDTDFAKYTFGVDLMTTSSRSVYGSEVNGRFHFASDQAQGITALENFDNLRPYRYYREVPLKDDVAVKGTIMNIGLYGQMRKNIAAGLEMTAGLRMDYASYPTANFNQLVYDELGIRTDNKLASFILQPRIQFNWDINENQTDYLRAGAGIFASDINNYMIINNLTFDGSNFATVDVRGADVPKPDFNAYRRDQSSIPTLAGRQIATINYTGENADVPTVYKANISYNRFLTDRLKLGLSGYMTLARNNYTYVDRNMVADPYFSLSNEANRGVFVRPETIPSNGQPDWQQGRISTQLGRVLELTSIGRVNQFAVVVDGTYRYFADGEITASYTWNDTKDNTSFNGNVANSATLSQPVVDDPRNLGGLTYSSNHFRHKVVAYGTAPTFWGVQFGLRFTGTGGTRYSLLSGGNTNGDFVTSSNDLAFVFDYTNPNTPESVRTGLQRILDNPEASQSIKDFITSASGEIAKRNGGINEFYGTIDLRLAKEIKFYKKHGVAISLEVFNFANMLNKEWGVYRSYGNTALYRVTGFDQATQQFNYAVNTAGVAGFNGNPWQLQVGARYAF